MARKVRITSRFLNGYSRRATKRESSARDSTKCEVARRGVERHGDGIERATRRADDHGARIREHRTVARTLEAVIRDLRVAALVRAHHREGVKGRRSGANHRARTADVDERPHVRERGKIIDVDASTNLYGCFARTDLAVAASFGQGERGGGHRGLGEKCAAIQAVMTR